MRSLMNLSRRLKPVFTGIVFIALSASLVGCDSCKEELPPPEPEPEVVPEPEPEPVDPLAQEKAEAEEQAETRAILTGDTARAVTAEMEALAATPEPPRREPSRPAEPKVGTVDNAALAKAFGAHDQAMRKCYERALKGSPHLQGKIRLHVVLAQTGVAETVEAQPMSLRDPVVGECMERVAKAISFPQPKGGPVSVNKVYAFFPDM